MECIETSTKVIKEPFEIPKPKSGWFSTSLIFSNIVLGTGLLNFASAYEAAGGVTSCILIQVFSLILVEAGLFIICYCSELSDTSSYQDVVRFYSGKVGSFFCNIFIVVHDFGTCISFLVIIADQIDQVMLYSFGPSFCHTWYLHRSFTLPILAIVLILPFCYAKLMGSFRLGSALGILTTLYLVFLSIYKYFDLSGDPILAEKIVNQGPNGASAIFHVIPIITFSFEAHIEGVVLYSSLKEKSMRRLSASILMKVIICVTIYNLVGVFSYLTFGDYVKTDLLATYYHIDVFIIIGMAMVALKCIMTYPVIFYCARMVVMDVFPKSICGVGLSEKSLRVASTTCMFAISVLIAIVVPTIGSIIALLGGSAALFILVFPGICYLQAHLDPRTNLEHLKRMFALFLITSGTFIIGCVTTEAIQMFTSGQMAETEIPCV